jgi:hypothetical protein
MRVRVGVAEQYGKTVLAADSCGRSAAEVLRASSSDALRMTVSLFRLSSYTVVSVVALCVQNCTVASSSCAVQSCPAYKLLFSHAEASMSESWTKQRVR